MFKKNFLISIFFLPLLSFTSAKADAPYYVPGETNEVGHGNIGSIDANGNINEVGKGNVGSISSDGNIYEVGRGNTGSIDANGNINEVGKGNIGSVTSDGNIYEVGKGNIGSVDTNGNVYATGSGNIGSVPPGNGYLAFQMIRRYNQQQAQRSQYSQQYAQQRNAEIEAQNAEINRENYESCKAVYRLCYAPYNQVYVCHVLSVLPDCNQYLDQLRVDYAEHAQEWHKKDCEMKAALCRNQEKESCRAYWGYCTDFDAVRRKDKQYQGVLPPVSTDFEAIEKQDSYYPCNEVGKYLFFSAKKEFYIPLFSARIVAGGVVEFRIHPGEPAFRRVGTIDETGKITADKHLSHKDRSMLKKVVLLGQIKANKYVMRCGIKAGPRTLGFYDAKEGGVFYDFLNEHPPQLAIKIKETDHTD